MNSLSRPLSPSVSGFSTAKMREEVDLLTSWANDGAASAFASCFGLSQNQVISQPQASSFQANVDETIAALTPKTFLGSVDTPWRCMGEGNMLGLSNHTSSSSQSSVSSVDSQSEYFAWESPPTESAAPIETKPLLWQRRLSKNYPSLSEAKPQQQAFVPAGDRLSSPLTSFLRENMLDSSYTTQNPSERKQERSPVIAIPDPVPVDGINHPLKRKRQGAEDWTDVSSQLARRRRKDMMQGVNNAANASHTSQGNHSGSATKTSRTTHGKIEKSHMAKWIDGKPIQVKLCEGSETRYTCPCDGCDKNFSTSGHARRHSRIHSKLEPFTCPHNGCGATFTRRDNCTHHQRVRHHCSLRARRLSEEGV